MITIEELADGAGETAKAGNTVDLNYKGTFTDGRVFDSGRFSFAIGSGQVIQGFDLGVTGMKVGGKRRITVPPELGYGARGAGPIPGNTTLVFELEILKIK
ncbi:MAG: FKBP-type peptidyl-prolyl cis-trans isomerase [Fimbriimonas sp.]|nr:FKBP-type peptidyl-prolyl cis-trans isomerase [Fimbriimonas sp.]